MPDTAKLCSSVSNLFKRELAVAYDLPVGFKPSGQAKPVKWFKPGFLKRKYRRNRKTSHRSRKQKKNYLQLLTTWAKDTIYVRLPEGKAFPRGCRVIKVIKNHSVILFESSSNKIGLARFLASLSSEYPDYVLNLTCFTWREFCTKVPCSRQQQITFAAGAPVVELRNNTVIVPERSLRPRGCKSSPLARENSSEKSCLIRTVYSESCLIKTRFLRSRKLIFEVVQTTSGWENRDNYWGLNPSTRTQVLSPDWWQLRSRLFSITKSDMNRNRVVRSSLDKQSLNVTPDIHDFDHDIPWIMGEDRDEIPDFSLFTGFIQ
jgi:hypothetical protein